MISFKDFINTLIESVKSKRIGKLIGGELYLHKNYEYTLPNQESLEKAKSYVPDDHLKKYNVVKYNNKLNAYSFIHSPDFDVADEPISGDSFRVYPDTGETKFTKQKSDPQIWHHKHEWVDSDYEGFDVNKSIKRSFDWKKVTDKIKQESDPMVMKKIGTKSYWEKNVVPFIQGS